MGEFKDIDWQYLAKQVHHRYSPVKVGDRARVYGAVESLRHLPFPQGYLDCLIMEMMDMLKETDGSALERTSVYLTFFGNGDRASHLKIGVARDVRHRLASLRTGNPMPNLWTYSAELISRRKAMAVESSLLKHMREDRAEGEWVHVYGLSEQAAEEIVKSLAEVATVAYKLGTVSFKRLEA